MEHLFKKNIVIQYLQLQFNLMYPSCLTDLMQYFVLFASPPLLIVFRMSKWFASVYCCRYYRCPFETLKHQS